MPPPGLELVELIGRALRAGRPGHWIGGQVPDAGQPLGVPHARMVRFRSSGRHELVAPTQPIRAVLPPRLALALETEHPIAVEQLTSQDRAAGKRLYAAALRDIAGLSYDAISETCGYRDKRTATRAVATARRQWQGIGAWPWFHVESISGPSRRWRDNGAGARLDAAFEIWRTERLGQRAEEPDPIRMDYGMWEEANRPRHLEVKGGKVYFDGQPSDFRLLDGRIVPPQ